MLDTQSALRQVEHWRTKITQIVTEHGHYNHLARQHRTQALELGLQAEIGAFFTRAFGHLSNLKRHLHNWREMEKYADVLHEIMHGKTVDLVDPLIEDDLSNLNPGQALEFTHGRNLIEKDIFILARREKALTHISTARETARTLGVGNTNIVARHLLKQSDPAIPGEVWHAWAPVRDYMKGNADLFKSARAKLEKQKGAYTLNQILDFMRDSMLSGYETDFARYERNYITFTQYKLDYLAVRGQALGISDEDIGAMARILKIEPERRRVKTMGPRPVAE